MIVCVIIPLFKGGMRMDIRVLKYFLAIAREENITRASEVLHIAQPSLSKQIIELEKELGKKLLIRGKRKVTLTDSGVLLKKRAEEIIQLFEKTQKELISDTDTLGGEISIGGGQSEVIIQAASILHNKYPNVSFNFYNGDAVDVKEKLDNGTLDFGILIEPVDITKYEHIPLPQKDIWGFLMRKDFPLATKEVIKPCHIENIPIVTPKRLELQRELCLWSGKELDELNIIATYNTFFNNPTLLVKNGFGCAFTLKQLVDLKSNSELCFIPIYPTHQIQLGIVWKRYQVFSKVSEKFLEVLKEILNR